MFEELEKETEDMFAETDAAAPQVSAPTQPQPSVSPSSSIPMSAPVAASSPIQERMETLASAKRPFPWKVIVLFVTIVIVIGLAFFLSMRILKSKTPATPIAPDTSTLESTTAPISETDSLVEQTAPLVTTTPEPEVQIPASPEADPDLDSDKDGLTDIREAQLGTNPNNPDTDADGLFDKEEVDVYRTNPLNPDTDGDSFLDGAEVKGGYNPNGPGKLLVIPQK